MHNSLDVNDYLVKANVRQTVNFLLTFAFVQLVYRFPPEHCTRLRGVRSLLSTLFSTPVESTEGISESWVRVRVTQENAKERARRNSKNRRVFFSRYFAVNNVRASCLHVPAGVLREAALAVGRAAYEVGVIPYLCVSSPHVPLCFTFVLTVRVPCLSWFGLTLLILPFCSTDRFIKEVRPT